MCVLSWQNGRIFGVGHDGVLRVGFNNYTVNGLYEFKHRLLWGGTCWGRGCKSACAYIEGRFNIYNHNAMTCALCLHEKPLLDSHLLPRAVYRRHLSGAGGEQLVMSKKPTEVDGGCSISTSHQVTKRLLCRHCEDILSRRGEKDTIPLLGSAAGSFPLLELLDQLKPTAESNEHRVYSLATSTLPVASLVHFGMGIFWKATQPKWNWGPYPANTVQLGEFEEELRRFVLGDCPSTPNIVLTIQCIDSSTFAALSNFPQSSRGQLGRQHWFRVLGVKFRLVASNRLENGLRRLAANSASQPIILRSRQPSEELSDWVKLVAGAPAAGKLRRNEEKIRERDSNDSNNSS